MSEASLHKADLFRYSLLAFPIAFAGFPLYVLAPDYYATTYGVSLSLLGFLLLGLRLFDALQDPVIGALSDRYRHASSWFMGAAAVMLCASMYGLFNALPASPALWFSCCIALAVTAYSILSINMNTLGGLWTKDAHAQTSIATWREACGLLGLLVAVSLPVLLEKYAGGQNAYFYFSLILSAAMLFAWLAFRPWLSAHIGKRKAMREAPRPILAGIGAVTPRTRCFLAIYGLSMLASSVPAVLVIFFVRDLLGAEEMTGFFLLLYFAAGAVSMPLWKAVSAALGKYRAWLLAMLLAAASFVWAFFLGNGDSWQYALICVFSGLALGADLALPPAILADHIHRDHAQPHAASHYALLALAAKLSLAVASAIALPVLDKAGFVPSAENAASALLALSAAYALVPSFLKLAAAIGLAYLFLHPQQGATYETRHTHRLTRSPHHV